MVKKPIKRNQTLILLEIAFLGLLCWMFLSSSLSNLQGNTAQANSAGKKAQKLQNPKKNKIPKDQRRWAPTEGYPEAPRLEAQVGTPNACTGFDFEGGAIQGFTTEAVFGTPQILWHVTNSLCRAFLSGHSTPYTFYYGQDGTCNYSTGARNAANLISPPISVAGKFAPFSLGFNYLLFVEGGGFDTTFVDISTDNGATWTQVASKANLINDNQWHNFALNVTTQIGAATSVRVRFRFDSIDNIANSTTGWHVDDIVVCGQPFNFCVQDDNTKDLLEINTTTGAYHLKRCGNSPTPVDVTGTGSVTTNGNIITFSTAFNGRFINATINTSTHVASATAKIVQGLSITTININDSNTTNNTCACP